MCASRQALSHCLPSSRRFASSRLTYAAVRLVWLAMGSTFTWRPRTVDSSLGMSNQFFVRDAMGESVFLEGLPNVRIFCFFARKTTFPAKKADSVGQRTSRSAPTYRVRKEAQSSTKQGSDPRNTRRTARCCVLLGEWGVCGCLRRGCTIKRMMPRVLLGAPGGYSVLLFTFLHSVHGVSLRGSVSVGSGVRR